MATAGDPRRGQRGDTQRSRQKLVTDLRRRQRIRPERRRPFAWYQADKLTGLTDGDPVDPWPDESGNERHLTKVGNQALPFYVESALNGLPGVSFFEESQEMRELDANFASVDVDRATFLAVLTDIDLSGSHLGTICGLISDDDTGVFSRIDNPDAFVGAAATESVHFFDDTPEGTGVGTRLLEVARTPNDLTIWVDGSVEGFDDTGFGSDPPAPPSTVDRLRIGNNTLEATLCEQVVLTDLDDVDRHEAWRAYLKDKWGV